MLTRDKEAVVVLDNRLRVRRISRKLFQCSTAYADEQLLRLLHIWRLSKQQLFIALIWYIYRLAQLFVPVVEVARHPGRWYVQCGASPRMPQDITSQIVLQITLFLRRRQKHKIQNHKAAHSNRSSEIDGRPT